MLRTAFDSDVECGFVCPPPLPRDCILQAIELSGFTIVTRQRVQLTRERAADFYAEHEGKPFFETLVDFMSSGPLIALVLAKPEAIVAWRALMGPTNAHNARQSEPRSLRARCAL